MSNEFHWLLYENYKYKIILSSDHIEIYDFAIDYSISLDELYNLLLNIFSFNGVSYLSEKCDICFSLYSINNKNIKPIARRLVNKSIKKKLCFRDKIWFLLQKEVFY